MPVEPDALFTQRVGVLPGYDVEHVGASMTWTPIFAKDAARNFGRVTPKLFFFVIK